MLFYIVFCLFSALTVGLVSIFLGLGGGVTLVPLLNIYFLFEKYPQEEFEKAKNKLLNN